MGKATLVKLCSITHSVLGCDRIDGRPVMFHVVVDKAGNPIPPASEAYPVGGSGFTGDGSGFIRSFFTDTVLQPTTVSQFSACSGGGGGESGGYTREAVLLDGALMVKWGDVSQDALPTAEKAAGELDITWAAGQVPVSARYVGTPADLDGNELLITSTTDVPFINQNDASGYWPFVGRQNRTRVRPEDPFQQQPDTDSDGFDAQDLPIATPGVVRKRCVGLQGDFGLYLTW